MTRSVRCGFSLLLMRLEPGDADRWRAVRRATGAKGREELRRKQARRHGKSNI
jgi:hypothetical protein